MTAAADHRPYRERPQDTAKMPSGAVIDMNDIDFALLKTADDCFELGQLLQERIIAIEYQLECHAAGFHSDGRPFSPDAPPQALWAARAKKALSFAKMQKADAAHRSQQIARDERIERLERQGKVERAFVDLAKVALPEKKFDELMKRALEQAGRGA